MVWRGSPDDGAIAHAEGIFDVRHIVLLGRFRLGLVLSLVTASGTLKVAGRPPLPRVPLS